MVGNLWCAECGKPVEYEPNTGDYTPCCNDCAMWSDIEFPYDGIPEHAPFNLNPLYLYVKGWPSGRPLALPEVHCTID